MMAAQQSTTDVRVAVGSNYASFVHSAPFTLLLQRVRPSSFPDDSSGSDDEENAGSSSKRPRELLEATKSAKAAMRAAVSCRARRAARQLRACCVRRGSGGADAQGHLPTSARRWPRQ